MSEKAANKPGRKLVPSDPNLTDAERKAIEAIKEYEVAERVLDMFKIENSAIMKTYGELLEELEQKRQVADARIRATDASYGKWERFSEQKKYFPDKVYEIVGKDKFLEMGGSISSQPVYSIDPKKIDLAIADGTIPEAGAEHVKKVTSKYRSPKVDS